MNRTPIRTLALVALVSLASRGAVGDEPAASDKLQDKLIGTWKLVSGKYGGRDFPFPEGTTTIKHVTPSQFMWASYDKDGTVTRAAGGAYRLRGDEYEETPEYGLGGDFEVVKGKAHTFRCRIEGNRWRHEGKLSNGQTIEEVWERVERK